MASKILKGLGVVFIFLVICFGALVGWSAYEKSQYATTAVPFIQKAIPEIAAGWKADVLISYMAPEAIKDIPEGDFAKLMVAYQKLGGLKSLGEPMFANVYKGYNAGTGPQKIITYNVPATFEAGDAKITIRVIDRDGSLKIYFLNINSKALIG